MRLRVDLQYGVRMWWEETKFDAGLSSWTAMHTHLHDGI